MNPYAREVTSIGLMRGVASLMVCYFHLAHENPKLPKESVMKQLSTYGWTGVQVFFIISGFVIPYAMYVKKYSVKQIGLFMEKRIIRIEPPYLISIVVVLVLNYISALLPGYGGAPLHVDWTNVAGHVGYLNIFTGKKWLQDVYWTLAVEFQYYILIAVVYGLITSVKIYYRLLFYCLFLTAISLKDTGSGFIFPYTGYFMLGILLFQYYCSIISDAEFWILLFFNVCFLYYFQGWIPAGISVVTMLLIAFIKKVPSFFRFADMISFSLYLVHIPIGGRLNNIAASFSSNIHYRELVAFAAMGISVLAAYVFYLLIERKFKNFSAAVAYKKRKFNGPVVNH